MESIGKKVDPKVILSKGDTVIHLTYGTGIIRNIVPIELGVIDQKKFQDVTGLDTEDYLIIVKFEGSSRLKKLSLNICNMRGYLQKVVYNESIRVQNEKTEITQQVMEDVTSEQPTQEEIITYDLGKQRASYTEVNTNLDSKIEYKPAHKAGIYIKNTIIEGGTNVCQGIA